ncbi:MAG TPA: hypothetical protein VIF62_33355 [Labilithrix sp.]
MRAALVALLFAACNDPILTGRLDTVPPVHRVAVDVVGSIVLVDEDADIETNNPTHIARAKEIHVPRDYRQNMEEALRLAGFTVTANAGDKWDLHAKLALAVSESGQTVRQVYRCNLKSPDGKVVAQIDWAWPEDTRVDGGEVYAFATHHLATEIATSPEVNAYLASRKK